MATHLTTWAALAALLSAFNPGALAQALPHTGSTQCKTTQANVRHCRAMDHSFVEISAEGFQVVTGELNGDLVTCVTWGLDSIENGQVSTSTDVEQICVWGVDGLPENSQSVQRLDVL